MNKVYFLDDNQREGLLKLWTWMKAFSRDDEIRVGGRVKSALHLFVMIEKVLSLNQYTNDEKDILNELRLIYIDKKELQYV